MYKELIKKYVKYLTINHIKEYAKIEHIMINDEEASILHQFIMENYLSLLEDNTTIFQLKGLIREDLYNTIYNLYQENKTKYL